MKIQETNGKVVVVSSFTTNLDHVATLADKNNWKYLRIDGKVKNCIRQAVIDQFNSGADATFIFLLSSRAGGVGISLIGANRLVMLDSDWNPAIDSQAMARVWREGQRKPVFIYRIYTKGSIEESIVKVCISFDSLIVS